MPKNLAVHWSQHPASFSSHGVCSEIADMAALLEHGCTTVFREAPLLHPTDSLATIWTSKNPGRRSKDQIDINWLCCMLDHVVCNWSWLCDYVFGSLVGLVDGSCDFPRWLLLSLAGSCVQCWRIRVACCWTMQPILGLSFLLASLHLFTLSLILYTVQYVLLQENPVTTMKSPICLASVAASHSAASVSAWHSFWTPQDCVARCFKQKKQSTNPSLLGVNSAPNRFKHPGDERINCRIKMCKYLRKRHPNYVLHRYCLLRPFGQRKDQAWQKRAITCGRRAGHAQSQLARRLFGK